MKKALFIFLTLLVAAFFVMQLGALGGNPPSDLGVHDSRLKPPSTSRNSVSSQAALYPDHPQRSYADIAPLPLKNATTVQAMTALKNALETQPNITIIQEKADYIHAQAQTPWMKFVDDLEFWFNPERGVIEVRSASRLGLEDFNTNRERIETIRAAYLAQP